MTFTQIRYFVEVAGCLNFTEAAKRLYVSQQAVSTQIQNLEKEIGVALFYRTTKQVSLTESGIILYREWKDMLARNDKALAMAIAAGNTKKRKITIGIAEMSGIIDAISVTLAKYGDLYQDVEFEFEILHFRKLEELLRKQEVDLIVTLSSELSASASDFHMRTISDLELGIVLSSKHLLAQKTKLDVKDLDQELFFIFSSSYSKDALEQIMAHCKREGFTPKAIKFFNNIESMEAELQMGRAVAMAYSVFFRNADNNLKIYPVKATFQQHLVAAWNKDADQKEDLEQVIDFLISQ